MSIVGSTVSDCSSVKSTESDTESRIQKCMDARDRLGLNAYITDKTKRLTAGPSYVRISSKTLMESYILPDDGNAVEEMFRKLAGLMRDCKKQNRKPPKTDFTCSSHTEKRKVWIDVDCLSCKRGDRIEETRHFKITKLVGLIVASVESVFDISVKDGVYLTNGKNSCGFHLFFNTLAYVAATASSFRSLLMDALDNAFRQAKITNASVDRGCTQMPLPTATHSNSPYSTRPYRMERCDETKWNKIRLEWTDMDVDTIKCFSSIAFPGVYEPKIVEPPLFRKPGSIKRRRECLYDPEHGKKTKLTDENADEAAGDSRTSLPVEHVGGHCVSDESAGGYSIQVPGCDDETPRSNTLPPEQQYEEHAGGHCVSDESAGGYSIPVPGSETPEEKVGFLTEDGLEPRPTIRQRQETAPASPSYSPPDTPVPRMRSPIESSDNLKTDDYDDEVSLLSKYSQSSLMSSYRCRSVKSPAQPAVQRRQRSATKRDRIEVTSVSPPPPTNVVERLPYECEEDKTSAFADKQYKASLLCAEEEEAAVSKTRINKENRTLGGETQRVYLIEGSGSNVTREYRLLVQLANVNRGVYQDDIISDREWIDLLVSYYDQHLRNPVLLAILKFVLEDKNVVKIFPRPELERVVTSVVQLMMPFKLKVDFDAPAEPTSETEVERAARPHKARLVGALIRICTHLFNMITAVYSDLWKIQKANERKDMSSLNRTVVNNAKRGNYVLQPALPGGFDDDFDCSASMVDAPAYKEIGGGSLATTNYTLLASLITREEKNLSDMSLYALLYYYHSFPLGAIDRIMDEVHHDGLMVTAAIRYFLMYDRKNGKTLTLQEIFEGFNDCAIFLRGPEDFIKMRRKTQKRGDTKKAGGSVVGVAQKNKDPDRKRRGGGGKPGDYTDTSGGGDDDAAVVGDVTPEEINRLLGRDGRRRKMCGNKSSATEIKYDFKDKHMWEAVINYYLRPVSIYDDKMVFANDNYDTLEEDAIESSVAHLATTNKNTKGDVQTAFKDARTAWRMPHGSQLIYESDLRSDRLGCCFHINVALKMYEMFCGGCVTRMKRVHKNYLIDRTRFNMTVYDVVAECRTAAVNLTAAVDRSYMNLLLRQPVVPPFLEENVNVRRLYMTRDAIEDGSFCCLSVMDYIRMLNLFERSNYKCKSELDTCEYVEQFLNDLYTNEIAAEHPPNPAANAKIRLLYAFYSLYLFEVVFNMRHVYAKRENIFVSLERLCNELDVRELIVHFFGESSMKRVEGLSDGLEHRIRSVADDWNSVKRTSGVGDSAGSTADGRFDVRPLLAVEIPDKTMRMKTLFGQFGFEVMQDCRGGAAVREDETVPEVFCDTTDSNSRVSFTSDESGGGGGGDDRVWDDDTRFEQEFYIAEDWLDTACERMLNKKVIGKTSRKTPVVAAGSGENMFAGETVRTIMRLETKRHIDNDRLGKLMDAAGTADGAFDRTMAAARYLPMRLKLLAFVLTAHSIKSKTNSICPDVVESVYREADGRFADESRTYEGDTNFGGPHGGGGGGPDPPEKVWCRRTSDLLPDDRLPLLLHARWLAEQRFDTNFFVGLDPVRVYSVLYEYMKKHADLYPSFREFDQTDGAATKNLCTAVMFLLIMSAYDQEHVDLYLKVFLAVEWPGQWAKTIFVWKSNSNAGKSYLFDAIVKRACANSTCINDPKGGKENAPEKAEYVRNFVLFANEFSQANSNELKKIVSESTFKFRMNYGNVMNEAYATGKIMFNCNTLPPTSDEAAINRLTLFDIPFWFCKRQRISDAMLNWIRGPKSSTARWEIAYRHELPSLLTADEKATLKSNDDTKDELDLFDEDAAVRRTTLATEYNKTTAALFLVQNKTSRLYVSSSPPTDRIVYGLVNITTHFSWLRFFKQLDTPVDFTTLPASSEAVRSEWLSLTLPYQEWKQITGARTDTNRVPAQSVYRSLQAFASKKNINYFGIKQFFETDFASSREAIKDEYYMWFDTKAFRE